jgi:CS domain
VWQQTLEEVTGFIKLPDNTKANMLDVKIGIHDFKVSMKGKPNEVIVEGKWCKKINPGESFWSVEKDGNKATMNVTVEKQEGKNWWNCLLQGDIEIDT